MPVNSITLSYDGLDRLTSADGAWGSGSFSYDALGNITNKTLGSELSPKRQDTLFMLRQ